MRLTHVELTYVNEIEAIYERQREVQLLRIRLTFHTMSLFTRVRFTSVRTEKLRDSGNPPLGHVLTL